MLVHNVSAYGDQPLPIARLLVSFRIVFFRFFICILLVSRLLRELFFLVAILGVVELEREFFLIKWRKCISAKAVMVFFRRLLSALLHRR